MMLALTWKLWSHNCPRCKRGDFKNWYVQYNSFRFFHVVLKEDMTGPLPFSRIIALYTFLSEWCVDGWFGCYAVLTMILSFIFVIDQADMFDWIDPLNAIDAALTKILRLHPGLLLIGGVDSGAYQPASSLSSSLLGPPELIVASPPPRGAASAQETASVPAEVIEQVSVILTFLSQLLRHGFNKIVFNSLEQVAALLSAADDDLPSKALQVLQSLSAPPMMHRQHAPDLTQHSTVLHAQRQFQSGSASRQQQQQTQIHDNILVMARGWGSRGCGLGLHTCVTADDSQLPSHAGELFFEFIPQNSSVDGNNKGSSLKSDATETFPPPAKKEKKDGTALHRKKKLKQDPSSNVLPQELQIQSSSNSNTNTTPSVAASSVYTYSEPVTIHATAAEMLQRNRGVPHLSQTTAGMFFSILNQPAHLYQDKYNNSSSNSTATSDSHSHTTLVKDVLPVEKYFALLSNIRLARGFHSHALRVKAVQDRLTALSVALTVYQAVEIMTGYFFAQPELCAELGDLLRPTISSSSAAADGSGTILSVGTHSAIPHDIQLLALEVLTALIARRDGAGAASASSGLSPVARNANVLAELGVGKGQYLGLLPTLIRYSLASLNTAQYTSSMVMATPASVAADRASTKPEDMRLDDDGNAATQGEIEIQSLALIDSILTLTSAVIAVPSGTSALTDCGFIPSLIGVIAADRNAAAAALASESGKAGLTVTEESFATCMRKFITAQSIQILESALVTHAAALSAFHDLNGTDLIISRVHQEIEATTREGLAFSTADHQSKTTRQDDDVVMASASGESLSKNSKEVSRPMRATRRALFFSLLNCLTVVFHHQESGGGGNSPQSTGSQLRTPELTGSLMDVLDHISDYGPVLASLTATMMSDVMNADPQVVHHVHESGLARSFLDMIQATKHTDENGDEWWEPTLPAMAELVMSVPNVLSALALTEDGAIAVKEANPFPSLLSLFCCPKYAMPLSRCMLNDMTAIVGTGMDELIRHVPTLRLLGMDALVAFLRRVVKLGADLLQQEGSDDDLIQMQKNRTHGTTLENARTCFAQYAFNVSQLLEQVLQHVDHVKPFVEGGGFDALLELFPMLLSANTRLLAHVSCLSNPFSANLTHFSTTNSMSLSVKAIAQHYDVSKLLPKLLTSLNGQLDKVQEAGEGLQQLLLERGGGQKQHVLSTDTIVPDKYKALDSRGLLEGVPALPLHACLDRQEDLPIVVALSKYLRESANTSWFVTSLSSVVKSACQRGLDVSQSWTGTDRDQSWKREVSSPEFADTVQRLTYMYTTAQLEACRVRTAEGFEARDAGRHKAPSKDNVFFPATYRLRIVCQDGAVVRDGIDIDSCPSVGSLEMGEIIEAYDRCINSSGVLRYRTAKGWISEHTRGHGREPIAEVVAVRGQCNTARSEESIVTKQKGRECGVPDLLSVSASILSRLHVGQKHLLSCMSRAVSQGIRARPIQARISSPAGEFSGKVLAIIKSSLNCCFDAGFSSSQLSQEVNVDEEQHAMPFDSGLSLYFGLAVELCHACLFEEKRERRTLNLAILVSLTSAEEVSDVFQNEKDAAEVESPLPSTGMFGAIRYVLRSTLQDLTTTAREEHKLEQDVLASEIPDPQARAEREKPRVGRSACSSFPPVLSLVRKLSSRSLIDGSNMASLLKGMKKSDFAMLIGELDAPFIDGPPKGSTSSSDRGSGFNASRYCRGLHFVLGRIMMEVWTDPRLTCVPATVLHPIVGALGEITGCLEEASKVVTTTPSDRVVGRVTSRSASGARRLELQRLAHAGSDMPVRVGVNMFQFNGADPNGADGVQEQAEEFEASEEAISRLNEMGFGRDHALEALESAETNRLEVAMEYALAHPPPSPASAERRRVAREGRRTERDARQTRQQELQDPSNQNLSEAAADTSVSADAATESITAAVGGSEPASAESNDMDVEKKESTPNPESKDIDKPTNPEEDLEDVSTARVKELLNTLRSSFSDVSLDVIEGGGMGVQAKEDTTSLSRGPLDAVLKDDFSRLGRPDDGNGNDPEAEAVTVVACNFLLEVCSRYSTERTVVAETLLTRIDALLVRNEKDDVCDIIAERESDFASLCHAGVILFRALPRTKPLLLRNGMLHSFLQLMRLELYPRKKGSRKIKRMSFMESHSSPTPRWLSSVILLLDAMAQPTSVQLMDDGFDDTSSGKSQQKTRGMSAKGEFTRMVKLQKEQEVLLAKTANDICAAVNQRGKPESPKKKAGSSKKKEAKKSVKDVKDTAEEKSDSTASGAAKGSSSATADGGDEKASGEAAFTKIPSFMPLMPAEDAESSMLICLRILKLRQKSSAKSSMYPSSAIHAALLLLARVLRTYNTASKCLKMGGAELILTLPSNCRFRGNTGLVTVILRHLLEDEATLRSAMETEIRSAVTRLHKQHHRGATGSNDRPKIKAKSFVQAVTPLICRDPLCFLRAAATSVRVEMGDGTGDGGSQIILLTNAERTKNMKAVNEVFDTPASFPSPKLSFQTPEKSASNPSSKQRGRTPSASKTDTTARARSKSPRFAKQQQASQIEQPSSLRKGKKDKNEKVLTQNATELHGSPSNHVTCLVLNQMIKSAETSRKLGESKGESVALLGTTGFLRLVDLLDILADLVLAVPACAAAIHRYKPQNTSNGKVRKGLTDIAHALCGCPAPPATAVSYLLHKVLPQPRSMTRSASKNDQDALTEERKKFYMQVRLAQSSSRLMVALCARPGEGRRRVVMDLAIALSGNKKGNDVTAMRKSGSDQEMWALQSWAELCLGLSAPKSTGSSSESNSALSWEVVKLMLQYGVAEALMVALQRVHLSHPLAAKTAGALLRPIEIFTRSSVIDSVSEMIKTEKTAEDEKKADSAPNKKTEGDNDNETEGAPSRITVGNRRTTLGPSQRPEGAFADDTMLEEGFDPDTAARAQRSARNRDLRDLVDGYFEGQDGMSIEEEDEDDDEGSEIDSSDEDDEMLVDMEDIDEDASDSEDESESDGSDDDDGEHDGIEMDDGDMESVNSSNDDSMRSSEDDGEEDEDDNEEDEDDDDSEVESEDVESDAWEGEEDQDFFASDVGGNGVDPEGDAALEGDSDEGWTRIDASGGGLLVSGGVGLDGNMSARQLGFRDAAEAVIGNILRSSDMRPEAIAELEETLGIRIAQEGGSRISSSRWTSAGPPRIGGDRRVTSTNNAAAAGGASSTTDSVRPADRGVVGIFPNVRQTNTIDSSSNANWTSNQWAETSAMDAVFGDTGDARSHALDHQEEEDADTDDLHVPANFSISLFPGGPATATHARAGQQAHALLSDIALRPVNDFAVDRSASRTHGRCSGSGGGRGAAGMYGTLYSAGSGATQILRLRRGADGMPYLEPNEGPGSQRTLGFGGSPSDTRWSEDGQPPDSTTADFTTAFEQALGATIARDLQVADSAPAATAPSDNVATGEAVDTANADSESAPSAAQAEGAAADNNAAPSVEDNATVTDGDAAATGDQAPNAEATDAMDIEQPSAPAATAAVAVASPAREESDAIDEGTESYRRSPAASDGEVVADSLATGLHLEENARMEDAPTEQATTVDGQVNVTGSDALQPQAVDTGMLAALVANAVAAATADAATSLAARAMEELTSSSMAPADTSTNEAQEISSAGGLVCPTGMVEEVFHSLPLEMQQELVEQYGGASSAQVAEQLDSSSGLDPEALAALPEDMRREVIQQEQEERERRQQQQRVQESPADPANAQDMDNASFVASLSPDLRSEILMTADESFLQTLPPDIIAEAQILRERASARQHRASAGAGVFDSQAPPMPARASSGAATSSNAGSGSARRRHIDRTPTGRIKVELDRHLLKRENADMDDKELPPLPPLFGNVITVESIRCLLELLYLISPVRPHRLLQKLFQNISCDATVRRVLLTSFVALLNGNTTLARSAVSSLTNASSGQDTKLPAISHAVVLFPPKTLIGSAPDVSDMNQDAHNNSGSMSMFRGRDAMNISAAATIASNLPASARGSDDDNVPPVVARRMIDTLFVLSKSIPRVPVDILRTDHPEMLEEKKSDNENATQLSCLDQLLDLIGNSMYARSSTNLEQLLNLIETNVSVMNHLPLDASLAPELTEKDKETVAAARKEYVQLPRPVIAQGRLRDLCSVLRLGSCKETCFQKVNVIARRLSRVEHNRNIILLELATVARGLASSAIEDMKLLVVQLDGAAKLQKQAQDHAALTLVAVASEGFSDMQGTLTVTGAKDDNNAFKVSSIPASAVTLSANSSELKLLRVLQTLHALCGDPEERKGSASDQPKVTSELISLLHSVELEYLWEQLSSCLRVVSVLEGVSTEEDDQGNDNDNDNAVQDDDHQDVEMKGKKLQSSIAGLLTRFLPTIEAFFVVNASSLGASSEEKKTEGEAKDDGDGDGKEAEEEDAGASEISNRARKAVSGEQPTSITDLSKLVGGDRLVSFVGSNKALLNALLRSNPSLLDKGLKAMVAVPQCRPYMDFDVKRHWFKAQVRRLRSRRHGSLRLSIRRKHVFEDAYHQLSPRTAEEMRGRLHITFRNEEGVDAGGLSREFFEILAREIFNPNYALFTATEDGCTFQPNPNSSINPDHLRYFRFVGRIVGKAVVDGFLLDAHFTRSLYKHMLGIKVRELKRNRIISCF
jgi:hypothetical protein